MGREAALLIGEEADDLPGVVIEVEPIRQYLDETGAAGGQLLSHVIGYTGPVSREELDSIETEGYLRDDVIGKTGVEASFEAQLRGTYGTQLVERDASGRLLDVIETTREPEPGTNLMLTIDADMQRLATQALTWGMDVADVSQGVTAVMNPADGRDPGHGLAARLRQQQVRRRHQRRRLRGLPVRSEQAPPQPRHQRHLSARAPPSSSSRPSRRWRRA